MKVFPRSVPEALTCVTVWKRFREIKRLYRELAKRHKALHLRGQVPEAREPGLFKRFDPDVIAERKDYILRLLDFAAQHPALYKSHPFLSFFESGTQICETPSPVHGKGNIENICDNLDLPFQSTVQMIESMKETEGKSQLTASFVEITKDQGQNDIEEPAPDNDNASVEEDTTSLCSILQLNIHVDNDYIYEAAYEFSQAVQAEVNQNYKEAYRKYNAGIEKLLVGSKGKFRCVTIPFPRFTTVIILDDTNDDRKAIAKAKVVKYMSRAQELHERHLLQESDWRRVASTLLYHPSSTKILLLQRSLHLSTDDADSSEDILLERPWNQLSKFKVTRVIETVMQVQDVTNKSTYIMKTIQKPSTNTNSHSIFLPQNVPYMVKLFGFFQSDSTIFLLLQQAKGGKLFDYIKTYTPTGHVAKSLSEIFTDFHNKSPSDDNNKSSTDDSGFVDLLPECERDKNEDTPEIQDSFPKTPEENQSSIPSFVTLSQEMDVNDLVSCSQRLLQSVSNTLEQFKDLHIDQKNLAENNDQSENETKTTAIQNSHKKTEVDIIEDNYEKSHSPVKLIPSPKRHVVLPEVMIKQWARELLVAIDSLHLKGIVLG